MILQSVRQNAVALALFALITALLLSSINNLTADRIAHAERVAAQKALLEIVPPNRHDNDLLLDTRPIPEQFWSLLGLDEGGDRGACVGGVGDDANIEHYGACGDTQNDVVHIGGA